MKLKRFRMYAVMMALSVVLGSLAGCQKPQSTQKETTPTATAAVKEGTKSGIDTSKEVNLVMYLTGEAPKDFNTVLGEINKLTKRDLNATLTVNYVPLADRKTKFPLLFASGEKFDLVFTANWCLFNEEGQKGAFMALNDLLPKYAPETFKQMPKEAWDEASINGKIYMVPQNYEEVNLNGIAVRGDLRKKYNIPEIKTLNDLGAYLNAVKTNEKNLMPFNAGTPDINFMRIWMCMGNAWRAAIDSATPVFQPLESPEKLFYLYDTPEYASFANLAYDWNEKGYWSKSMFSNQVSSKDAFVSEKSAAAAVNLSDFNGTFYQKVMETHPEWQPEFYPVAAGAKLEKGSYLANGMAVNAKSVNPERALMLLELLRNNEEYFMLTTYGIKGKHYELTKDGRLTLPQGLTAKDNGFPAESMSSWGWRNSKFFKFSEKSWPQYNAVREDIVKRSIVSKLTGFIFNQEAVKTEMAAISQVTKQFNTVIEWGSMDPKDSIPQMKQKLKEAGMEKVYSEYKKQMDEFLAKKK